MLQDQNNRRRIDILEREIKSLRGMVSKISTATPRIDRDQRQIRIARTVNGIVDGQDETPLYPVDVEDTQRPSVFRIEYIDWSFPIWGEGGQAGATQPAPDNTTIQQNTRRANQRSYQNTALALDGSYYPFGSLVVVLCEFGQAVIVGNFGGNYRPLIRFNLNANLAVEDESVEVSTIASYGPGRRHKPGLGAATAWNPLTSTGDHQYFGDSGACGWGMWSYGGGAGTYGDTNLWIIDLECPGV